MSKPQTFAEDCLTRLKNIQFNLKRLSDRLPGNFFHLLV